MSGLPFDSHQLLHNGEVLSGRSLAEYGVHKGSVLELVPYEPFVPQPMPEGSPLLSSPDHELVRTFFPLECTIIFTVRIQPVASSCPCHYLQASWHDAHKQQLNDISSL